MEKSFCKSSTPYVLTTIMLAFGNEAFASNYDALEYSSLITQATQKQYVRVQVNLDIDVPLSAPRDQPVALKSKLAAMEQALITELDSSISPSGIWRNGLGQMGVYASVDALKRLTTSTHVRSFGPDHTDSMRSTVYDGDDRLAEIQAEIDQKGYADVDVTLNLDNFEFDIGPDGKTVHHPSAAQLVETKTKLPNFLNSLPAAAVPNIAQAKSGAILASVNTTSTTPIQRLRINRHGYYLLKEHAQVRSLRLAGAKETESQKLDPEVLATARKEGSAEVMVTLQRFSGYSPLRGNMAPTAWRSQASSIRKAFADILTAIEPNNAQQINDFDGLASISVRLSATAIERLYKDTDPRILSVSLNRPGSVSNLAESTALMNLPQGWDKGYIGSGQYVAIFDTGVKKSHPFLQMASGQPKVVYEACFGSNTTDGFRTTCPSADIYGDSPLGLAGSAEPCPYIGCDHGTYITGVAAGKRGWNRLSGVAPGASIISVKVHSYKTTGSTTTTAVFDADIAMGMQALLRAGISEVTANFSLGRDRYSSSAGGCNQYNQTVTDLVASLLSMRIPVVASSGNGSQRGTIEWPACISNVTKVGAIYDTTGALLPLSNIANPANYYGHFFLAPGYSIISADPWGTTQSSPGGTSQAAAHVTGLYALIKAAAPGISVADAGAWIDANAVPVSLGTSYTLKRVRVPTM